MCIVQAAIAAATVQFDVVELFCVSVCVSKEWNSFNFGIRMELIKDHLELGR